MPKKKRVQIKAYRRKLKKPEGVNGTGKLTDEIEEEICRLIRGQLTLTDACQYVGINPGTVWEWRGRGQAEPNSRYGKFERAVNEALMLAKAYLVHGVARHQDVRGKIFILKNRYPSEFRDRIVQEVSGPGGVAVPVNVNINPFEIKIVTSGEPEQFKTVPYDRREVMDGAD